LLGYVDADGVRRMIVAKAKSGASGGEVQLAWDPRCGGFLPDNPDTPDPSAPPDDWSADFDAQLGTYN
jgi:hypothetical protein